MKLLAAAAWLLCTFVLGSAVAATPHVSASRGTGHSLALKSDGSVVAWGPDLYGQLGSGRTLVNATPAKIQGLPVITAISAFADHVLALDASGQVWSWGNNAWAQLGERVERNSARPGRILGLSNVIAIEAGHQLSAALKADGTVWVWGRYFEGGGGDEDFDTQDNPVPVQKLSGVVEISAGAKHLLARKLDNTVWALGENRLGQLGLGDRVNRRDFVQVPGLSNVVKIAASDSISGAATASGALFLWGTSDFSNPSGTRTSPGLATGLPPSDPIADFDLRTYGAPAIALASRRLLRIESGFTLSDAAQPPVPGTSPIVNLSSLMGLSSAVVLQNGAAHIYSNNSLGDGGTGSTTVNNMMQWYQPAGMPALKTIEAGRSTYFGLTQGGDVYAWGLDSEGLFANGVLSVTSVPKPVVGLPSNIVQVEAGYFYSLALGADGRVWGWGVNSSGELGRGYGQPPSSTPLQSNVTGVSALAACASSNSLYLKPDGTVWFVGMQLLNLISGTQISGLPPIAKIGCAWQAYYAIDTQGRLWAWGENRDGLIGDGTFVNRLQPVQVSAFGGVAVTAVTGTHFGLALTSDGRVWLWGRHPARHDDPPNPTPTPIAGISGATAISAGHNHVMIRMSDGTIKTFGINSAAVAPIDETDETTAGMLHTVPEIDGVESIGAGSNASFAMRTDGTVFAWGDNCTAAQFCQTVGDGTFAERNRPVVVLRENAAGNLDNGDWFLDLKPGVAKSIPPSKVPRLVPVSDALSGGGVLNIDAAINYRQVDNGRRVGVYVVGLVPPAFLDEVKASPQEKRLARTRSKDGGGAPVLVQLTPQGWVNVSGQLIAFTTAVVNGNGAANNILNNIRTAAIPGARFCIGYGDSAANMLSEGTLRDVVTLPGATSVVSGSPCVLAGVYVSGPATSIEGSAVDFRATVVGAASPSGTVQFRDAGAALGAALAVSPVNAAVAIAQINTSSLAAGEHGIGAEYSGDANNPPSRAEALVHRVAPAASASSIALSGPASSRTGAEVAFTAVVTGRAPTGTVQFRDGGGNLGAPVALVNASAVLRTTFAAAATRSMDAVYSGDGGNLPSTSAPIAHRVVSDLATEVILTASAESPILGQPVTFTATVTGNNPTGTLTVRDDSSGRTYGPQDLSSGSAQVTAPDLAVGAHVFTATYAGDGGNVAVTSAPLIVAVQAPTPPRLFNISTRMRVLTGDDVLIGGFIIGGSTPKTVVVRARGPSLAAAGVPGVLANPVLNLYSGSTLLASNDDWQASSSAATVEASGFAPADPREAAIHRTLNPGAYTAIVSGVGGTTGVGIIEVFEVNASAVPLINISTRGAVHTGDNVMIGGFIIQGSGPQTVVVRARGPSLAAHGVPNLLMNPVLNLYSGSTLVGSNDDWQTAANQATLAASGFAPAEAQESAIYITLNPGAYTAIVSGAGGTTGVGIVEVFAVP